MILDSDEESSGSHCSDLETESDESDSDATVIYDVGRSRCERNCSRCAHR